MGEDNANPPPMGEAQINNGLVQNEIQGVGEIEGTPIKRNKYVELKMVVMTLTVLTCQATLYHLLTVILT